MAPSCCVHQSDNGGYPAACDVSTLVRIAMTLLIYKKVVSVLNRVDDTRQFFALPTLEVELEVLAELSNHAAINYHKRRLLNIYTLSPQTNIQFIQNFSYKISLRCDGFVCVIILGPVNTFALLVCSQKVQTRAQLILTTTQTSRRKVQCDSLPGNKIQLKELV